jgi:hypothetical protein
MLAATNSINGRLGAGNTDAVALFAQLMPTLAGNIATAIEFVHDRFPTVPGWTFAVTVLLFHCRWVGQFSPSSPEIAGRSSQKTAKKSPTIAFQAAPLAHLACPRACMEIGNPLTTQGRMPVHHREQSADVSIHRADHRRAVRK